MWLQALRNMFERVRVFVRASQGLIEDIIVPLRDNNAVVCCLLELYDARGGGCLGGLAMRCILMASQVAVPCSLPSWPSVTALFRAQYSRSDWSDYVMIVNNGRASVPLPGFFLQSCSDSPHLMTFEMVYKLNGYKRKVKVFPATACMRRLLRP